MSSPPQDPHTITFGAAGDICLSNRSGVQICGLQIQENGYDWPFEKVLPYLRQADVLFGNMESIVLPPDYPDAEIEPEGLVTKFDGTEALKRAGFDFMNMAANHVLDGGEVGMFHTQQLIENLGIATAGVGRTQEEARQMRVLEVGGMRVGFLCYCKDNVYSLGTDGPCHAYYTREAVLEDIAACRDRVDVLVLSIHADLENVETPSPKRRDEFREFAREGATIILGHHPHVPQGVELIKGALIVYSLSNFYFFPHTMPWHKKKRPHTAQTFVLLAEVSTSGVQSFSRVPCQIQNPPNMRPVPLVGQEAEVLLAYFAELDRKCQDDRTVRANWRAAALRNLKSNVTAAREMNRSTKPRGRFMRRMAKFLEEEFDLDVDQVLERLLIQLLFVPENRSWIAEVAEAVRERWSELSTLEDPYHRPAHRLDYNRSGRVQEDPESSLSRSGS